MGTVTTSYHQILYMTQLTQREVNSLHLHGQRRFEQQDFKTAKRCFVEIVEKYEDAGRPVPSIIAFNAAVCYFKLLPYASNKAVNYARIQEYLRRALKADPLSAITCYLL